MRDRAVFVHCYASFGARAGRGVRLRGYMAPRVAMASITRLGWCSLRDPLRKTVCVALRKRIWEAWSILLRVPFCATKIYDSGMPLWFKWGQQVEMSQSNSRRLLSTMPLLQQNCPTALPSKPIFCSVARALSCKMDRSPRFMRSAGSSA